MVEIEKLTDFELLHFLKHVNSKIKKSKPDPNEDEWVKFRTPSFNRERTEGLMIKGMIEKELKKRGIRF